MKKVAITKTDDTVESYDFINAFSLNNHEYVILSKNEKKAVDTAEYNVAYVSEIVKENDQISLVGITVDSEWDAVKNAMADMSKGAKEGISFNYEGKIILKGNKKMALPEKSFNSLIAPEAPEVTVNPSINEQAQTTNNVQVETPVAPPTFEAPVAPATSSVETPVTAPTFDTPVTPVAETNIFDTPAAPTFEVPAAPVVEAPAATATQANIFDTPAAPVAETNIFDNLSPVTETLVEPTAPSVETPVNTPVMETPVAQTNIFDTPSMPMIEESKMPEFKVPTVENMATPEAKTVIEPQPIINEIQSPSFPTYNMFDTPEASVTSEPELSAPTYQAPSNSRYEELKAFRKEIDELARRVDTMMAEMEEEKVNSRVA